MALFLWIQSGFNTYRLAKNMSENSTAKLWANSRLLYMQNDDKNIVKRKSFGESWSPHHTCAGKKFMEE